MSAQEDPEKLLDQVVTEMQEDLIKMRQAAAQVRARSDGLCGHWRSPPQPLPMPRCSALICRLHSNSCAVLLALQVMASQKQLEAKFKQAQATAVSTAHKQVGHYDIPCAVTQRSPMCAPSPYFLAGRLAETCRARSAEG